MSALFVLVLGACDRGDGTAGGISVPTTSPGEVVGIDEFRAEQVVEPIRGYGDFSGMDFFDVDGSEVASLLRRCMVDQGFAVDLFESGDGLDFSNVPDSQSEAAVSVLDRCVAGLNLPEPRPPTREELQNHFDALIETKECLEEMGYAIDEPPTFDSFADSYVAGPEGPWHPYLSIPMSVTDAELRRIESTCPQP